MTTLYIDADACPVKAEAERVATRLRLPMVLVCNGGLRPSPNPFVSLQIVPEGPERRAGGMASSAGRPPASGASRPSRRTTIRSRQPLAVRTY